MIQRVAVGSAEDQTCEGLPSPEEQGVVEPEGKTYIRANTWGHCHLEGAMIQILLLALGQQQPWECYVGLDLGENTFSTPSFFFASFFLDFLFL